MENDLIAGKRTARTEAVIFSIFILLNLVNTWLPEIYITLDGPAHLYNSALLNLYSSSSFLQEHYAQNSVILPNYLSHLLLSKLFLFMGPLTAEKVLLSLIVVFLPLSFRAAVKQFSGKVSIYTFLIFPLVFNKLLHAGFYNFNLGFIFLNCQLLLFYRFLSGRQDIRIVLLFVLNTLVLFYAHAFLFSLSMILMFTYTLFYQELEWKVRIRKLLYIGALSLPSLVFFVIFTVTIPVPDYNTDLKPYEKCAALFNFSPGLVFDIDDELPFSSVITLLLIFLISSVITARLVKGEKVLNMRTDLFLVVPLLLIYLMFHSKDGLFGGMFIHRLLFLTFYLVTFWLCCNLANIRFLVLFALVLVSYSYIKLSFARDKVITKASRQASEVIAAGAYLPDRSIVYSVNLSDTWFHKHVSNYLGLNKEVVLSDNYEAVLGWFPLKWRKTVNSPISPAATDGGGSQPDHIFVYGLHKTPDDPAYIELNTFLKEKTSVIYRSEDKFCTLYRINY